MVKKLKDEGGYSLVEVVVAIMLLSIAIIPMVSMFDAGLRAAVLGGNYDQARALAGKQLETVKSKSYNEIRDSFPVASSTPDPVTGVYQDSTDRTDPEFPGITYRVRKEYVALVANEIRPDATAIALKRMMQVTVTAKWSGGQYKTTALVSKSKS